MVEYLGWVDLDLGSSPGWCAATVATYCLSWLEHPKSKSTQPRYSTTRVTMYIFVHSHQVITEVGNATSTVTPRTFYESERCALVWGYTAETRDCDSKMSCGVWDGSLSLPPKTNNFRVKVARFGFLRIPIPVLWGILEEFEPELESKE